jgi:hypothetical protein
MARGELFIQLVVNYADDEKLADVSRSARLLYIDLCLKAKATSNDGIFTASQVEKVMYPETPAKAKRAIGELVASGAVMWDEQRKLFTVPGFLKRNKSRAQIAEDRRLAEEAAALGNHKRWHKGRGETDRKCPHCVAEASAPGSGKGSAPGSPPRSGTGSGPRNRTESLETETETETEVLGGALGDPLTPPATPPPFPRCERHKDRPADGPCGACADRRKARNAWDQADAARRRAQPQCPHHRGEPAHACGRCRSEALAAQEP